MTEYTISSEAIREYMSARDRTAYWVQVHSSQTSGNPLLSPSSPPSILSDSDAPSFGPSESDAASTHSLPPRMVLRYDDGRPDIPIPHPTGSSSPPRSHPKQSGSLSPRSQGQQSPHHSRHASSQSRSRAGSSTPAIPQPQPRHAQTLSYVTVPLESIEPRPQISPPRSPESIVILPSRESGDSSESQVHSVPINPRSIGHSHAPAASTVHGTSRGPASSSPPQQNGGPEIASPRPRRAFNSSHGSQRSAQTPPPGHSQHPTSGPSHRGHRSRAHSTLPYDYHPPAIIYAPSSNHSKPRYAPPAIVYSPPKHSGSRGHAPSITYSQSDPLPQTAFGSQHSRFGSHMSGGFSSHHSPSTIFEEQAGDSGSRSRSRGRADEGRGSRRGSSRGHGRYRGRSPTPSLDDSDDARSETSAGTYYVLPTPGQKVQIIVPNAASVFTATSTTKSAHSPQSSHSGGPKKPFFQRIFHIPKLSSYVDSKSSDSGRSSGRRLKRRHTIGPANIPPESEDSAKRT